MITARVLVPELLGSQSDAIDVGRWLVSRIRSHEPVSEMTAFEWADVIQPELTVLVDARISRDQQRGLQPAYIWADAGHTTLARPSLFATETTREVDRLAGLVRPAILDAIGQLGGHGFERLCSYLTQEYGMDPGVRGLLGQAGDGGVDFFGVLRPYQLPGPERLYTLGRRFLGQAKLRFRAIVDSDAIEAFGSRVASARINNAADFRVPSEFRGFDEPIVGLFITAGTLGRSARRAATRHVVYAIEGDQVAEDLARSSSVSSWLNETGTGIDQRRFLEFFATDQWIAMAHRGGDTEIRGVI